MSCDREEDIAGGGAVGDTQGVAEVAIEVAPAEGDVMAIGEADGLVTEGVAGGTGYAGLSRAGFTGDDGVLPLLDALDEVTDDALFAGRQPELVVVDLFGERYGVEAEVVGVGGHDSSPSEGRFL